MPAVVLATVTAKHVHITSDKGVVDININNIDIHIESSQSDKPVVALATVIANHERFLQM